MGNLRKSAPRPTGVAPGAPTAKGGELTVIYADDILVFPGRNAGGVVMVGNIVLKAWAVMEKLYLTPSSQKASYAVDGDEDSEGFMPKIEGTHPGDEIEINEFAQNSLGTPFVIVYGLGCGTNQGKVLGSPCNPLKCKPEFTDDKDGTKTNFVFEQTVKSKEIAGFYNGTTSFAVYPETADSDVDMLIASGNVYQLPAAPVTAVITAASIDIPVGELITLIGGGGVGPYTLDKGIAGQVTVMLINGTQWVALEDATITFEVYADDAITYLIEKSRTA